MLSMLGNLFVFYNFSRNTCNNYIVRNIFRNNSSSGYSNIVSYLYWTQYYSTRANIAIITYKNFRSINRMSTPKKNHWQDCTVVSDMHP